MRRIAILAVLVPLLVPATGWSQTRQQQPPAPPPGAEATEQLLMTPPPGWNIQGSGANRNSVTKQLFPPGQTSETWNEMMTIQVLADATAVPRDYIQRIIEASRNNCEASGPSPLNEALTNGYPVATLTVTCTKGRQTGLGGLVAAKVIRGKAALYVVQRIWRGTAFNRDEVPPIPKDMLQDWAAFLRGVSVCDTADPTHHPCPK